MSLESYARYPLLLGPSPIQRLDRLTKHLGGATIWAKREDMNSGLAFGGNKMRKLEYLVADALAQGCDTLVSIGGDQSNHTRQVAAAAAVTGMKCVLVQESWVDWPDVTYDRVGTPPIPLHMLPESQLPEPDGSDDTFEIVAAHHLAAEVENVMGELVRREREVVELRFGLLDARARTLEEVGQYFGVTRERIRQIEAKALRHLRHYTRARRLKDYY